MGFQVGNPAMRHPHVFFGVVVVHAVAVFVANVRISVRQQDARHRHVEAMGLDNRLGLSGRGKVSPEQRWSLNSLQSGPTTCPARSSILRDC